MSEGFVFLRMLQCGVNEMSHEKGIEAAIQAFYSLGDSMQDRMKKAIKAYIDASGMVMVPREPTDEMQLVANESMSLAGFFSPPKQVWDSAFKAMIAAATNPFQTPEES